MKFKFIVSKPANFFFFVDNFSEWNVFWRKNYNKEWIKETGKLNKEEKNALNSYKLLMKKYNFDENYREIRKVFYKNSKDESIKTIIKKLDGKINKDETIIITNVFNTFSNRFKKIWQKYEPILTNNKKYFLKDYHVMKEKLDLAYEKLSAFYGKKIENKNCSIFLILCPKDKQGGRAIDEKTISIEFNKDKNQLIKFWFLVIHETSHAIFEDREYKNWIKEFIEKQKPLKSFTAEKIGVKNILKEIITGLTRISTYSLLDETNITIPTANKLPILEKGNPNVYLDALRQLARKDLKKDIEKYFSTNRKIDTNFLNKCWSFLQKNID